MGISTFPFKLDAENPRCFSSSLRDFTLIISFSGGRETRRGFFVRPIIKRRPAQRSAVCTSSPLTRCSLADGIWHLRGCYVVPTCDHQLLAYQPSLSQPS